MRFRSLPLRHWQAPRLERAEAVFIVGIIGLAVTVGFIGPSWRLALHILIVLWAALVGAMIPTIIEHRRAEAAWVSDQADDDERAIRHDLASALMTLEGGVSALRFLNHGPESSEAEGIAHAIETEIRRIRRLSLHRPNSRCRSVVADAVDTVIALHQASGLSIRYDIEPGVEVAIDADDLARAVSNLIENCRIHAPGADIVVTGHSQATRFRLTVSDNGPGIEAQIANDVCAIGTSTRDGGGLGLYSVRSLIESSGGAVIIEPSQAGTAVSLDLPLSTRLSPSIPPPVSSPFHEPLGIPSIARMRAMPIDATGTIPPPTGTGRR